MYAALSGETKNDILGQFGGGNFSTFKSNLVDLTVAKLAPIGTEMRRIQADPSYIDGILRNGADRAREKATRTMAAVRDIVGFIR
jgi:tryptophanyl-tRNA synthetase